MTIAPRTSETTTAERHLLARAIEPLQLVALVPAVLAVVLPIVRHRDDLTVDEERPLGLLGALVAVVREGEGTVAVVVLSALLLSLLVMTGVALSSALVPDGGHRARTAATGAATVTALVALLALAPALSAAGDTAYASGGNHHTFAVHWHGVLMTLLVPALLGLVQLRADAARTR